MYGFQLSFGQTESAIIQGKHIYRPNTLSDPDTLPPTAGIDSVTQFRLDSLEALRLKYIQDSIEAREIFVRDSIARRQHILDSLRFIKDQLPPLLEAALRTFSENIILFSSPIGIVGDSMLSNFTSSMLPLTIDQPYTPWKNTVNLSDKPIRLSIDEKTRKIIAIDAPGMSCSFQHLTRTDILKISWKGMVSSVASGKVYKSPVDSVFFDARGRVAKVKRYILFSQVVNNYQPGNFLFSHLTQVKQYEYGTDNKLNRYQLVNFCDRASSKDPVKVCYMVTYTISKQGDNFVMTRKNDPPNEYSDGTYIYEFDNNNILKSVAFSNTKQSENWKTYIETNEAGYVSNYIYENKGIVNKSLVINYYLDDPKAKNKIETISCTFEDDGVSYYQINNTTGKSRVRDRLTMEWSPWR